MELQLTIATDKWLHFWFSFLLSWVDPALSALAGLAKEVWDLLGHGTPDWADLAADLLGIMAALVVGA
jgi:hypothetical protein